MTGEFSHMCPFAPSKTLYEESNCSMVISDSIYPQIFSDIVSEKHFKSGGVWEPARVLMLWKFSLRIWVAILFSFT